MRKYSLKLAGVLTLMAAAVLSLSRALPAQVFPSPSSPPGDTAQSVPSGILMQALGNAGESVKNLHLEELVTRNAPNQWIKALVAAALGLVLGKLLAFVLGWLARRFQRRGWTVWQQLAAGLGGPISLATLTAGVKTGTVMFLDLGTGNLETFWLGTLSFVFWISGLWYVYNLITIVDVMVHRLTARTGSALDQQLAPMIRKTLRFVVVLFGLLAVAQNVFGANIGAWLAGLGIAGLAVSLAAQDSLKNIFGSITILIDRPFRVGEAISCGGHTGAVEEIGFRSTKVRTSTGNIVSIPNSSIVNEAIENIDRRPYIQRLFNVTITYDTPREKVQQAVDLLRAILEEPGIREPIHRPIGSKDSPPRVFFNEFKADSLNILVVYWYAPPAYWDYLEHAHRLNLRILEEFEKAGIEFAFPTQTLYLANDPKRRLAVDRL
jgi:small-conductance mechanosensitive channel